MERRIDMFGSLNLPCEDLGSLCLREGVGLWCLVRGKVGMGGAEGI